MTDSIQQPPEEKDRLTFDKAIFAKLRKVINDCFAEHPELRSVSVVLDYRGGLNNSSVDKGMWLSAEGNTHTAESIVGSLHNGLLMLEHQFTQMTRLHQQMQDALQTLGHEIRKRSKELEQLSQDEEDAKTKGQGS